ncbi:MAG: stability determinant [Burkholderiales bacterium]|nr:stability determinant [Burkholderiales bacterium]
MSKALSPMESGFATEEEAEAYDRWFRARVQASLDDPRPNIPHDEVIAEMRRLVEDRRHEKDARSVAT